jgi:aryl-alcohol dehydrogenase-like predicted oxidoreductase
MAQTYGIAILPWAPSAGGFFAEKYERDQPAPLGSRYEAFWRGFYKESFNQARIFDVQEAVLALAKEMSVSGYSLALAWCLSRPGITSPIIGPRTQEQLTDSLSAIGIELSNKELAALDSVAPAGSVTVPYIEYKGVHPFRW